MREFLPINVEQGDSNSFGKLLDNDHTGRFKSVQSSDPGSWRRMRKGLDLMTTVQARLRINHSLALEHRTSKVRAGLDPGS